LDKKIKALATVFIEIRGHFCGSKCPYFNVTKCNLFLVNLESSFDKSQYLRCRNCKEVIML